MIILTLLSVASVALFIVNIAQYIRMGHKRNLYGSIVSAVCCVGAVILSATVADQHLVLPFP